MKDTRTTAERLRAERKARGLQQGELAHKAGITQQAVSAIERGGTTQTKHVVALARALGVSPDWLATGDGPRAPRWEALVDVSSQPPEVQRALLDLISGLESGRIEPVQFVYLAKALLPQSDT